MLSIVVSQEILGLGWDFDSSEAYYWDASVTALDEYNEPIESIYYSHLEGLSGTVHHFWGYLTRVGDGDD